MKQTKLLIVKITLVENNNILFGVLDDLCFIGRLVWVAVKDYKQIVFIGTKKKTDCMHFLSLFVYFLQAMKHFIWVFSYSLLSKNSLSFCFSFLLRCCSFQILKAKAYFFYLSCWSNVNPVKNSFLSSLSLVCSNSSDRSLKRLSLSLIRISNCCLQSLS